MTTPEPTDQIVIAGAGYGGLRTTLRLASWLRGRHPQVTLTLIDQHDYHQVLTELPRVAGGSRAADELRVPLKTVLSERVRFVQSTITGFNFATHRVSTEAGELPFTRLVLALGSRPNDFGIPGLAERALTIGSVEEAKRILAAVDTQVAAAVNATTDADRQRLMTVVVGGGGASGVELAGELAEELPDLARRHDLDPDLCRVILVDAGPTILAGSSPQLVNKALGILRDLNVEVRTNAAIVRATDDGFVLKSGDTVAGGAFIWAGGVMAPPIIAGSGLPVGHNGRIKVDQYLRALDHPDIYVAGDLVSLTNPETGRAVPPTAQLALAMGETVATNLLAELDGREIEPFVYHDKGIIISIGPRSGVASVAGQAIGGRLAHVLKEAIEWEYRQSVRHLRGWSPIG